MSVVLAGSLLGCSENTPLAEREVTFGRAVDEAALEEGIKLTPGVELVRVERRRQDRYLFEAGPHDLFGHAEHASGSDKVRFRVYRWRGRPTETTREAANTLLDKMTDRIEQAMANRNVGAGL